MLLVCWRVTGFTTICCTGIVFASRKTNIERSIQPLLQPKRHKILCLHSIERLALLCRVTKRKNSEEKRKQGSNLYDNRGKKDGGYVNPNEKLSGSTEITLWRWIHICNVIGQSIVMFGNEIRTEKRGGEISENILSAKPSDKFLIFNKGEGSFTWQIFKIYSSHAAGANFPRNRHFVGKKFNPLIVTVCWRSLSILHLFGAVIFQKSCQVLDSFPKF